MKLDNLLKITLKPSNYHVWRRHIKASLEAAYLYKYVDGSSSPFPGHYLEWYEQDQELLSTLKATMSPEIASLCTGFRTSRDLWSFLESYFDKIQPMSTDDDDKQQHHHLRPFYEWEDDRIHKHNRKFPLQWEFHAKFGQFPVSCQFRFAGFEKWETCNFNSTAGGDISRLLDQSRSEED